MGSKTRRCIVPSCRHRRMKNDNEKRAMFKIPANEEKARMWAANIPGLEQPLKPSQTVCEKHFEERFIIRYRECNTGVVRSRLNQKAVPTIFDTENEPNQNTVPFNEYNGPSRIVYNSPGVSGRDISMLELSNTFLDSSSSNHTTNNETSLQDIVKDLSLSENLLMDIKQEMFPVSEDGVKEECLEDGTKSEDLDMPELTAYENLHKNFSFYITQLPENWNLTRLSLGTDQVYAFSKECTVSENDALIVMNEKSIVINKNGDVHYSIHGKMLNTITPYTPNVISDIDTLLDVVLKFDEVKVCQGICTNEFEVDKDFIIYTDDLGVSRHVDCSLEADKQQCDACYEYSQYLIQVMINNTPVLGNEAAYFYNNPIYS